MRKTKGIRRRWLLAAASTLALLPFVAGCGDLSRDELNRGVESLSAIAAQGQLIADGVARDATKSTYTRVMAKTLGGESEHEAEKLADAEPDSEVLGQRDAAVGIAGDLAKLFLQLQTYPGDEHRGAVVQKQMGEVKERADTVVERLTGEPQ
jgi:hypothetical protein